MKIGIIGDLHFRESLGYADYIKDHRNKEKKEVLDFIVKSLKSCDTIVMMGDQLNARNNPSSVIKEFVAFLERFKNKELYIIAGNHEKFGDGRSAIDFLKEIDKKNWHIITNEPFFTRIHGLQAVFLPYFTKAELDVDDNNVGSKKLLEMVKTGDILFAHHTISDTLTTTGIQTNLFKEVILSKKELEDRFRMIVGGHIHKPQINNNTIIAGSIFNNEVGETGKKIWEILPMDLNYREIELPGRPIHKVTNPENLSEYEDKSIVKIIVDDPKLKKNIEQIKKEAQRFDAYILLEQYPNERKKIHFDEGMLQFNIEDLLKVYAKQKKVDYDKLISAWELVK